MIGLVAIVLYGTAALGVGFYVGFWVGNNSCPGTLKGEMGQIKALCTKARGHLGYCASGSGESTYTWSRES